MDTYLAVELLQRRVLGRCTLCDYVRGVLAQKGVGDYRVVSGWTFRNERFGPRCAGGVVEEFRGVGGVTASMSCRIDDAQIACAACSFSKYDGHDQDTPSMGLEAQDGSDLHPRQIDERNADVRHRRPP